MKWTPAKRRAFAIKMAKARAAKQGTPRRKRGATDKPTTPHGSRSHISASKEDRRRGARSNAVRGITAARSGPRAPLRRRRNPDLLMLLQNPSSSPQLRAAVKAFEKFHGVKPREIIELPGSGPPLIGMGTLREVVYQPTRGERAGPAFFHKFGRGAAVAATADGKVVVLVPSKGKPFRVDWDRGLIG